MNFNRNCFLLTYNVRSINSKIFSSKYTNNKKITKTPYQLFQHNSTKLTPLKQYVSFLKPAIFNINETWLLEGDNPLLFPNYNLVETRSKKTAQRKGGVALLVHKDLGKKR
jgi:hypothetical protein